MTRIPRNIAASARQRLLNLSKTDGTDGSRDQHNASVVSVLIIGKPAATPPNPFFDAVREIGGCPRLIDISLWSGPVHLESDTAESEARSHSDLPCPTLLPYVRRRLLPMVSFPEIGGCPCLIAPRLIAPRPLLVTQRVQMPLSSQQKKSYKAH